jgi:hypothetical protein
LCAIRAPQLIQTLASTPDSECTAPCGDTVGIRPRLDQIAEHRRLQPGRYDLRSRKNHDRRLDRLQEQTARTETPTMSEDSSPTLSSLDLTTTSEDNPTNQSNQEHVDMTTKRANISLFYGDYRESETPHTWLRNFELETTMSGFDEPKKMEVFRICLIPGEELGDWWEEMRTKINRTKWEEVRGAFETKWPTPKKSGHGGA